MQYSVRTRADGGTRTTRLTLTGPDLDMINLIDGLNLLLRGETIGDNQRRQVSVLYQSLTIGTGLVQLDESVVVD